MKFNAVYLTDNEEELKELRTQLGVLEKYTQSTTAGDNVVHVFCAYDNYCAARDGKTVLVAPRNGELASIRHVSVTADMSVSHPHDVCYRLSVGNLNFNVYHKPVQDFGKYFPSEEKKEVQRTEESGSGLLDLSVEEGGEKHGKLS